MTTNANYARRVRRAAAKLGCRINRDQTLQHVHSGRVLFGPATFSEIEAFIHERTDGATGPVGNKILNMGRENGITEDLWNAAVATGDGGHRLPYRVEILVESEAAARERLALIETLISEPFIWRIESIDMLIDEPTWQGHSGFLIAFGKSAGKEAPHGATEHVTP